MPTPDRTSHPLAYQHYLLRLQFFFYAKTWVTGFASPPPLSSCSRCKAVFEQLRHLLDSEESSSKEEDVLLEKQYIRRTMSAIRRLVLCLDELPKMVKGEEQGKADMVKALFYPCTAMWAGGHGSKVMFVQDLFNLLQNRLPEETNEESERNNAISTIQEWIENWKVGSTWAQQYGFDHLSVQNLMQDDEQGDEIVTELTLKECVISLLIQLSPYVF
ncbi:hypothetical protein HII31_13200 [Pseudocercospora fuligena]|uniref:Uncharacterized protein n=1 Tax=Pseudocercospora fuligena TaxID=685502 RepID=A0A8H6R8J3_9PEZI|nr:hypothetical protein HII31_13200 [Pseudocercospora fuligena]